MFLQNFLVMVNLVENYFTWKLLTACTQSRQKKQWKGKGNIISFDQQMGNWATVDLKHLPKIMLEIEAELEMYARALPVYLYIYFI